MKQCTICGTELDANPLSGPAHARKHRNEFERLVGRSPEDYDEVRALLVDGDPPADYDGDIGRLTTIDEFGEAR